MTLATLGLAGGLLSLLTLNHFTVDWLFQTHQEAMTKHNHAWVRARHCLIYALGFLPLLYLMHFTPLLMLVSFNILFWSHHILDTYLLVYLWARYIRRPPEMVKAIKQTGIDGYITVLPPDPKQGFVQFVQTPLGKILLIAVDQITHILCLLPIVVLALTSNSP
jgi:Protein of unknown function (DUF3307)